MADDFHHLTCERRDAVEYLTLNRPDVRNALNDEVIGELGEWAVCRTTATGVRVAVLQGAGPAFCAGADIGYMARTLEFSAEQNLAAARAMAQVFGALNALPFPLVGRIQGAAIGGGAGLAAVCDMAIAEEHAVFGFTEVRLGILPAVISPYVRAKIGESASRRWFLTGGRFTAAEARAMGLVHLVVPRAELDAAVAATVRDVLSASPSAIARAKHLLATLARGNGGTDSNASTVDQTSRAIAEQRVSPEGQEGLRAFLEKRKPRWAE